VCVCVFTGVIERFFGGSFLCVAVGCFAQGFVSCALWGGVYRYDLVCFLSRGGLRIVEVHVGVTC